VYKLQFCTFIFAVLLHFGRHRFSIMSTEILAIWQSFVVFAPYFSDIKLQRYSGHDFDLSDQVTSSVMWPLYSQYGVSYRWSIRTDRLSCTVFETLSFKRNGGTTLTVRVTWRHLWFPMCGFLLVVNMNWPCISHGCRDIELQKYLSHDLDLLGSRDVICHMTIGFAIWGFL